MVSAGKGQMKGMPFALAIAIYWLHVLYLVPDTCVTCHDGLGLILCTTYFKTIRSEWV